MKILNLLSVCYKYIIMVFCDKNMMLKTKKCERLRKFPDVFKKLGIDVIL